MLSLRDRALLLIGFAGAFRLVGVWVSTTRTAPFTPTAASFPSERWGRDPEIARKQWRSPTVASRDLSRPGTHGLAHGSIHQRWPALVL